MLYLAFGVFVFGVLGSLSFIALLPGVLLGVFELVLTEDLGVLGALSSDALGVFGVDGVLLLEPEDLPGVAGCGSAAGEDLLIVIFCGDSKRSALEVARGAVEERPPDPRIEVRR